LRLQFVDQNIAMTSCSLQALMSVKTRFAEKVLAHETVTCCGVVLVTTAAFLCLCTAFSQRKKVHESIEMKRCGQVVECVSFGDLEGSLANRTFDCCL